jgi:hypothetical protein
MQFPTVEECDFERQFLFVVYVAIFHRYDLKRVSLKSQITVLSSYVKIELFIATFMMHDSLLNFHSVFLRHPVYIYIYIYILYVLILIIYNSM